MPDDCDRKFFSRLETAKLLKITETWVLCSVECGTLEGPLNTYIGFLIAYVAPPGLTKTNVGFLQFLLKRVASD